MKVTDEILAVFDVTLSETDELSYCAARQLRNTYLEDQYPDLVVYVALSTVTLKSA